MQLVRRPLAPRELDYELLWLLVSAGSLGLGAIWFWLGLPWPGCIFQLLTGHPCPTCGATRSVLAFMHGHLVAAWNWNPLALTALCALLLFDLYALLVILMRTPRWRLVALTRREKYSARAVLLMLVTVNWIYLLLGKPLV